MTEPTIICAKCKNEIKLTESLAAPLIESTRLDYEQRLALKALEQGFPREKQNTPVESPRRRVSAARFSRRGTRRTSGAKTSSPISKGSRPEDRHRIWSSQRVGI